MQSNRRQHSTVDSPSAFHCEALENRRLFAFGLTTTTSSFIVDTGGGTLFTILRGGAVSSTIHLGDMTSVKYNGTELLATYAATRRYSHYEQGLTSSAQISATVDPKGQWIKITCDDSAAASGGVIQYYVAKKGENNIYMASLPTDVNNGPGEGRYLAYLSRSVFTNIEDASNISTTDATVEGSDVLQHDDRHHEVEVLQHPPDDRQRGARRDRNRCRCVHGYRYRVLCVTNRGAHAGHIHDHAGGR